MDVVVARGSAASVMVTAAGTCSVRASVSEKTYCVCYVYEHVGMGIVVSACSVIAMRSSGFKGVAISLTTSMSFHSMVDGIVPF